MKKGVVSQEECRRLFAALRENQVLMEILRAAEGLGLAEYYVGAGCICQTVWNIQNGLDPMYGISDVDFVYFDSGDLSWEGEDRIIRSVKERFAGLPVEMDVKNQARVHLWYEQYYGYPLQPYSSLESAIDTWPTTATAVGVRMEQEALIVYAPFGLTDLFSGTIRPNMVQIREETYRAKCEKWLRKWKNLQVIEW